MTEQDRSFRVLYTKGGNKKRKTYQDGILSVSSSALTLIDADGKDVHKKKCYMPTVTCGEEIVLGIYEVQIEEENGVVSEEISQASIKNPPPPLISAVVGLGYVRHTSKSYQSIAEPSIQLKKTKLENVPAATEQKKFVSKK